MSRKQALGIIIGMVVIIPSLCVFCYGGYVTYVFLNPSLPPGMTEQDIEYMEPRAIDACRAEADLLHPNLTYNATSSEYSWGNHYVVVNGTLGRRPFECVVFFGPENYRRAGNVYLTRR
jgi:hypothetical protein